MLVSAREQLRRAAPCGWAEGTGLCTMADRENRKMAFHSQLPAPSALLWFCLLTTQQATDHYLSAERLQFCIGLSTVRETRDYTQVSASRKTVSTIDLSTSAERNGSKSRWFLKEVLMTTLTHSGHKILWPSNFLLKAGLTITDSKHPSRGLGLIVAGRSRLLLG